MQQCERALMQNENKIASQKTLIDEICDEMVQLDMPQSGSFYAFQIFSNQKAMIESNLRFATEELHILLMQKTQLQEQYKKLSIEYEKILFLDKSEQDHMLKRLKKQEELEIDEVAVMLYNNAGGRAI